MSSPGSSAPALPGDRRPLATMFIATSLIAVILCAGPGEPVQAQAGVSTSTEPDTLAGDRTTELGVGVQAGWPTGLALLVSRTGTDVDLLTAWRLETFFYGHVHVRLREGSLPPDPAVGYYLGPGISVHARDGQLRVGGSGQAGARYRLDPFEFYVQVAPRIEVVPEVRFGVTLGGGVYFLL